MQNGIAQELPESQWKQCHWNFIAQQTGENLMRN